MKSAALVFYEEFHWASLFSAKNLTPMKWALHFIGQAGQAIAYGERKDRNKSITKIIFILLYKN